MDLTAEHGRHPRRAKPLSDWEQVIVQVTAPANQRNVIAKPYNQLDRLLWQPSS